MNLLSFLLDPLYDVDILVEKHIHIVFPIEFNEMVDSLVFYSSPYNFSLSRTTVQGVERGGGLQKETT